MKTNAYLEAEQERSMSAVKQYASKSIEVYMGCLSRYDKDPIHMATIYNLELGLAISCIHDVEIGKLVDRYDAEKVNADYVDAMIKSIFMEHLADVPYAEFVKAIEELKRNSLRQGKRDKLAEIKKAMEIEY